ncbi:transmembrane protein 59 isoform X2 [Rhineura floridana]|uniref:transmembrane protein 59 isoform X2 n=1 Tax=Rhineura floridana TaxID=261503 RepID=UPI002AC852ED|nr:transmembrane protein 59 isoform X2 [Rhineura floridana]
MAAAQPRRLGSLLLILLALGCEAARLDIKPAPDSLSEAFEPALGNSALCQRTCQSTYPLHTYPKDQDLGRTLNVRRISHKSPLWFFPHHIPFSGLLPVLCPLEGCCWQSLAEPGRAWHSQGSTTSNSSQPGRKEEELYACQRGCRLFSICQFVDDGIDLNRTKLECDSACTEAYTSQSDEQYACHLGCQNQLPYAELRRQQLMSLMPRMHLLFPLTLVRSFWSDMMETAHSFITSSWTFYLQADDGKIVIFQSKPEVQYVQSSDQETTNLKESSLNQVSYLQPEGSQTHKGFFEEDESDNFFRCVSINSGWILTTTLILSVLVLLWICCATVTTAVEQYVPSEKLSIYGDLEYMNQQKLNRYPTSALMVFKCKDDEEAGPLPTKVNLAQSAI